MDGKIGETGCPMPLPEASFSCQREKCANYVQSVAIVRDNRAVIIPVTCESYATVFPEAECPVEAAVKEQAKQIIDAIKSDD